MRSHKRLRIATLSVTIRKEIVDLSKRLPDWLGKDHQRAEKKTRVPKSGSKLEALDHRARLRAVGQ